MVLGQAFGVRVRLNYLFLALILAAAAGGLGREMGILVGCLLTHELAHLVVARGYDLGVYEVELFPFGGVARTGGALEGDPLTETSVALAGPLNNFFLAALGVAISRLGAGEPALLNLFIDSNLTLAAFNLLPALPLDGGRVLRAYRAQRAGLRRATRETAALGKRLALAVAGAGLAGVMAGYLTFNLVVLGIFLYHAASREAMSGAFTTMRDLVAKGQELGRRGSLPVRHLAVQASTPAGEVLKAFVPLRYHLITVVGEGLVELGDVGEADFLGGLEKHGLAAPVGNFLPNRKT